MRARLARPPVWAIAAAGAFLVGGVAQATVLVGRPTAGVGATIARAARRGLAGPRGPRGAPGPLGPRGPRGAAAIIAQPVAINWQNGQSAGRDRATFVAPGIGAGQVVCNRQAQQVLFVPYDQGADSAMWTTRTEYYPQYGRVITDVRAAKHALYTGAGFNEGMNLQAGASTGNGTFLGLISSSGDRNTAGGHGRPPTSLRLSWYWQFADGDPRCYVAGTVYAPGPAA